MFPASFLLSITRFAGDLPINFGIAVLPWGAQWYFMPVRAEPLARPVLQGRFGVKILETIWLSGHAAKPGRIPLACRRVKYIVDISVVLI